MAIYWLFQYPLSGLSLKPVTLWTMDPYYFNYFPSLSLFLIYKILLVNLILYLGIILYFMPTPSRRLTLFEIPYSVRLLQFRNCHTTVYQPLPILLLLKHYQFHSHSYYYLLDSLYISKLSRSNKIQHQPLITCSRVFRGNLPPSIWENLLPSKTWNQSNPFPYLPPSSLGHQCITTRCIFTSFKLITYYSTKCSIWAPIQATTTTPLGFLIAGHTQFVLLLHLKTYHPTKSSYPS